MMRPLAASQASHAKTTMSGPRLSVLRRSPQILPRFAPDFGFVLLAIIDLKFLISGPFWFAERFRAAAGSVRKMMAN
jgi:hypothetical protein